MSFAEKITMKMGSVSHIGELRVHESLETEPFMWTPSRCKGKLKTELLVSLHISYTSAVKDAFIKVSNSGKHSAIILLVLSANDEHIFILRFKSW